MCAHVCLHACVRVHVCVHVVSPSPAFPPWGAGAAVSPELTVLSSCCAKGGRLQRQDSASHAPSWGCQGQGRKGWADVGVPPYPPRTWGAPFCRRRKTFCSLFFLHCCQSAATPWQYPAVPPGATEGPGVSQDSGEKPQGTGTKETEFCSPESPVAWGGQPSGPCACGGPGARWWGQHSPVTLPWARTPASHVSSFVPLGESHTPWALVFFSRKWSEHLPIPRVDVKKVEVVDDNFLKAGRYEVLLVSPKQCKGFVQMVPVNPHKAPGAQALLCSPWWGPEAQAGPPTQTHPDIRPGSRTGVPGA